MKKLSIIILLLFLTSQFTFAQGSPPLLLDDTGTPGPGGWEINLVTSFEHSSKVNEFEAPLVDVNYGWGERIQLKIEFPLLVEQEEDFDTQIRFDGIEFGVKYRFLGEDDAGTSMSCYPQIYYVVNGENDLEFFLPVEFHREWETFGLTVEIGHAWVNGKSEGWEGGIGAAIFFDETEILFEWHSAMLEAPVKLYEPMIDVGFVWDWSENSSLLFALGKSLHSSDEETNLWGMGGVQFIF